MKKIKELSEELGVSRQTINRYINKTAGFKEKYVVIKGRTNFVNEDGQKLIKSHFESNEEKKETQSSTDNNDELVDVLKKELHSKNQQLETMQILLDQQQRLTSQLTHNMNKLKEELDYERANRIELAAEDTQETDIDETDTKESFKNTTDAQRAEDSQAPRYYFGFRPMNQKKWWQFWK
ncbi:putative DNA-binding transcriptional regulator [Holzapfeliella sp. He02]|uniref:DNA-binding transcriptional regulator n=1 Tax=Holzapfeliella saturejae TaxID=3082953 RepID=A0ABU8SHT6_9LACO